jgi:hypothetical protein
LTGLGFTVDEVYILLAKVRKDFSRIMICSYLQREQGFSTGDQRPCHRYQTMNVEDVPKVFGEAALLDSQIRSMCAFDTSQSMIKYISGDRSSV